MQKLKHVQVRLENTKPGEVKSDEEFEARLAKEAGRCPCGDGIMGHFGPCVSKEGRPFADFQRR